MSSRPARSLKARALQWLAQREHSRLELRRKLLNAARQASEASADEAGAAADDASVAALAERVDALLDWLEAGRYLSAERFVESRIHVRASRYGNLRIRQELQQHDLAIDPATAAALDASELERARAVRGRRFGTAPGDVAERARQARFLTGRGFSPEIVRQVLREAARQGVEDTTADDADAERHAHA